jgi:hypothetical protein
MSHSAVLQRALHAYRGGSQVASISLSGPAPVQRAAWLVQDDNDFFRENEEMDELRERAFDQPPRRMLPEEMRQAPPPGISPEQVRQILRMSIKNPHIRELMLHVHSAYLEHCAEGGLCGVLLSSIPFLLQHGMFLNRLPERLGRARFNVRRQADPRQYYVTLCAYILAALIAVKYADNLLAQGLLEKAEARLVQLQAERVATEPRRAVEAREVVDAAAEMVNELAAEPE